MEALSAIVDADETLVLLQRLRGKVDAEQRVLEALPCWNPELNAEDPDGKLAAEVGAARACSASSWHQACAESTNPNRCPRARIERRRTDDVEQCEDRLRRAGVPPRQAELVVAAIRGKARLGMTPALAATRQWLDGRKAFLVLTGDKGLGKTVAAAWALGKRGGRYLTAYALSRPGVNLEEVAAAPLLVIDQLGRENVGASGFFLSSLEEVLDARYAARRPTLMCCNLQPEQLAERYGEVIADRILEDGDVVKLEGVSLRGQP